MEQLTQLVCFVSVCKTVHVYRDSLANNAKTDTPSEAIKLRLTWDLHLWQFVALQVAGLADIVGASF